MFDIEINMSPGEVNVQTTQERGHNTQELSANAVNKIISIADTADPVIRQQAQAFKERMFYVIFHTLNPIFKNDRKKKKSALNYQNQCTKRL